jgi:hypothetical protein
MIGFNDEEVKNTPKEKLVFIARFNPDTYAAISKKNSFEAGEHKPYGYVFDKEDVKKFHYSQNVHGAYKDVDSEDEDEAPFSIEVDSSEKFEVDSELGREDNHSDLFSGASEIHDHALDNLVADFSAAGGFHDPFAPDFGNTLQASGFGTLIGGADVNVADQAEDDEVQAPVPISFDVTKVCNPLSPHFFKTDEM